MRWLEDKLFEGKMEGNKCEKFRIFSRLEEAPKDKSSSDLRPGGDDVDQTGASSTERNIIELLSAPGIPNWQELATRVNNPIIPIN